MEAPLKSIARRIHWSLALRAAVFALAWWIAPFWLFFVIALYLYFIPWFQPGKLAIPFFLFLVLCLVQAPSVLFILIFAAIFYSILLIKDLLVIDRRSAYEALVLVLSFLLLRDFYLRFNEGVTGAALLWALLLSAALALLLRSLIGAAFCEDGAAENGSGMAYGGIVRVVSWLSYLLFLQIIFTGLFLPLDFLYQSVIVFLVVVLVVELIPEAISTGFELSQKRILTTAMTIFTLFVVVLVSARWGL